MDQKTKEAMCDRIIEGYKPPITNLVGGFIAILIGKELLEQGHKYESKN